MAVKRQNDRLHVGAWIAFDLRNILIWHIVATQPTPAVHLHWSRFTLMSWEIREYRFGFSSNCFLQKLQQKKYFSSRYILVAFASSSSKIARQTGSVAMEHSSYQHTPYDAGIEMSFFVDFFSYEKRFRVFHVFGRELVPVHMRFFG